MPHSPPEGIIPPGVGTSIKDYVPEIPRVYDRPWWWLGEPDPDSVGE